MKSQLLVACAVAVCVVASAKSSAAQTSQELLLRLEAKIDTLTKENAALRERVSRIEAARVTPAVRVRVASLGHTASDAAPMAAGPAVNSARAAALPVKAIPPSEMRASWSGFYAGIHGGYAQHETNHLDIPATFESALFTQRGAIVGGQLGYNWQQGSFVAGVEADGSWISGRENVNSTSIFPAPPTVFTADDFTQMTWLATARIRTGLAYDGTLFYVTAGGAAGGVKNRRTFAVNGGPTSFEDDSRTKWGWVVGGGLEHLLTSTWTSRLEALYVDLGDSEADQIPPPAGFTANNRFRFSDTATIIRLGVNHKFE